MPPGTPSPVPATHDTIGHEPDEPAPSGDDGRRSQRTAVATAGFLGRYRGQSRIHTASDLRVFLTWCTDHHLAPSTLSRSAGHRLRRMSGGMQQTRCFQPSTVSRRVPAESPTLGLSHLQLEAMLVAARQSAHASDIALVCFLGRLGLRIFETCGRQLPVFMQSWRGTHSMVPFRYSPSSHSPQQ